MKPPYPNYRPSVSEWLEEVPKHWEVKRLGYIADYRTSNVDKKSNDQELPVRLCNYTDVYHQERIRASDGDFMEATASAQEIARFKLSVGDVPITKDSEDWTDIAVPALVEETADDFVCGYHLGIIRPDPLADPAFVFRAMQSVTVNSQLQVSASGITRYGLPKPAVSEALIPVPPLSEQRVIAGFLDHATAKVDALVAKKRQLIDRLAEYRTVLITRTVTKGLPPDVAKAEGFEPSPPLKPSGVEEFGAVPGHWVVLPLRQIGRFFKGGGGTKADEVDGGIPCVRYGDLYTQHQFHIRGSRAGIAEASTSQYRRLQYGDLLFAGSGETLEEIGKSAVNLIDGRAYCGGDVIVFRPFNEIDATFLGYAADCLPAIYQKACMGRGVTVMHIYSSELKELQMPLPPLDEQRAIAAFLDRQAERIDALSARVRAAIERLTEYRSTLITAAVTGKIDVRDREPVETEANA